LLPGLNFYRNLLIDEAFGGSRWEFLEFKCFLLPNFLNMCTFNNLLQIPLTSFHTEGPSVAAVEESELVHHLRSQISQLNKDITGLHAMFATRANMVCSFSIALCYCR
jgi:hypothetical protein